MSLDHFSGNKTTNGWIEVICGSMFSGKTEELIRRIERVQLAQQKWIVFKPKIDTRYDEQKVVSHNGAAVPAIVAKNAESIIENWSNEHVVGIDEAQFFDAQLIYVCTELANKGVRVIVAGLDTDYTGAAFGSIPQLMAMAEYVTKMHAICLSCGSLAQFSHRKVAQKEQVMLGATDEYEPLCRSCFHLKTANR